MQSRFKTATTAKAAGSAAGIRTVSRAAASTKAPATRAKGSLSSAMDAHAIEDDSHSGTTLYMRNRWRAYVSGAEYVDRDLGYGSSDDDRSSRSSSPPSYPRSSHADVEVFLDDEPFQEDETVVAEWRIGSYARSTIVRIVCCRFRFFFFLIWCRVRQAGP